MPCLPRIRRAARPRRAPDEGDIAVLPQLQVYASSAFPARPKADQASHAVLLLGLRRVRPRKRVVRGTRSLPVLLSAASSGFAMTVLVAAVDLISSAASCQPSRNPPGQFFEGLHHAQTTRTLVDPALNTRRHVTVPGYWRPSSARAVYNTVVLEQADRHQYPLTHLALC